MSQDRWTAVDAYFESMLVPRDPDLESALAASEAAGLPPHSVSASQGKLLMLLAQLVGAKRILEIGTLGGYSTIWLARALPEDGHLTTLEADPHHTEVARENIARAGFAARVDVRLGPAIETLPILADEISAPFDFIFIDADKPSNPVYFKWALRLSKPGGVILIDNVVRDGQVVEKDHEDPRVQGVRQLNVLLREEPRVDATSIQTVGRKGYDGFTLVRVAR